MMTEGRWCLELRMSGPHGEYYDVAVPLDSRTARDVYQITPYDSFSDFVPKTSPVDVVVERLKRREFRKELFVRAAENLGRQLAERMEDIEGWHGVDRAR